MPQNDRSHVTHDRRSGEGRPTADAVARRDMNEFPPSKASSQKRSSWSSKGAGHCWSGFTSYPSDWRCAPCNGNNFSAEVVLRADRKKSTPRKFSWGGLMRIFALADAFGRRKTSAEEE
jgi:hypothetical protein